MDEDDIEPPPAEPLALMGTDMPSVSPPPLPFSSNFKLLPSEGN